LLPQHIEFWVKQLFPATATDNEKSKFNKAKTKSDISKCQKMVTLSPRAAVTYESGRVVVQSRLGISEG
jgi:hypothetical protein